MANEKITILKMLEERKITAAEAARLLESVDTGAGTAGPAAPGNPPLPPPQSSMPKPPGTSAPPEPPRAYDGRNNGPAPSGGYAPPSGPSASRPHSRNFEEVTGDLSKKFESFAKDMEPKLQKFTETVAEKIVSGADRLSKTFSSDSAAHGAPYRPANPGPAPARGYSPAPPPAPAHTAAPGASGYEKNIELVVAAGYNELNLAGLNGDVRIKGYNGDKITARIAYKPKRAGASIELMKLGGKYYLKYEEDEFERVSIDAYVPERLFQVININGINGNMDISSLAAQDMQFANANGQTNLSGLGAKNIKADCSNGKFMLSHIAADSVTAENFNGNLDAEELDTARLSLTNYNGALSLLVSSFARYDEYLWSVETSNAKLTINVPTLPDLGYHIKAHTTLGDIRVGLTGLQFLINDPALVEARSVHFDRAAKRVKLAAETSNASLLIN